MEFKSSKVWHSAMKIRAINCIQRFKGVIALAIVFVPTYSFAVDMNCKMYKPNQDETLSYRKPGVEEIWKVDVTVQNAEHDIFIPWGFTLKVYDCPLREKCVQIGQEFVSFAAVSTDVPKGQKRTFAIIVPFRHKLTTNSNLRYECTDLVGPEMNSKNSKSTK